MNERKTESVVRSHFQKYSGEVDIEEQISDIPKIQKILKTASKKGSGAGYPEFIITYKKNPDLLVIIECKADPAKHESRSRDKYSEYAVDGVLLYASHLSKEYDVLAIAVSGQVESELRVSHFLQLKDEKKAVPFAGDKLLPAEDYLSAYLQSPEKFRQDYERLLDFSRELNETLHSHKILENQRSLLISCVLIALESPAFKKAYKEYENPADLANYMVNTVVDELRKASIQDEKLENLRIQFSFIRTDTSLSKLSNVLRQIIQDRDENINTFIKNHRYYDILGELYVQFLRYANSDKGLGIVLTPPHITELFSELAGVTKDDIVYDNCTGTGGFLISAMRKMIIDAKDDQLAIKRIKATQLIGVEYQAHIFALACSNMYIHHDGKTNIINGSCLDPEVMDAVKKSRPTVGLLNPPYKADKKHDREELEYVLNNLECLSPGGTTVAIVPLSSALAQKGKPYQLKKKLLEKHTLEAVLSMPDELFINSKVAVVSCVMIFTAHKPHPINKEVYFGFYKEDGFIKRKNKGRVDAFGRWESIKDEWLTLYRNRKERPGLSVNKVVSPEDEWCAEAYMDTDYSVLDDKAFESGILKYSSYLFQNRLITTTSSAAQNDGSVALNLEGWKAYDFPELFKVTSSRDDLMENLTPGGDTPYITSTEFNNGVTNMVLEPARNAAGTITANRGGSVGHFFYQPRAYLTTPVDVRILTPRFPMNQYLGMFFTTILGLEKNKFNYSRKMGTSRLNNLSIKLPTKNDQPDFDYMERYIRSLPYSKNI
ncbi:MAG TPA: N-6 DNA methylase [Candidatus Paceibacterota bacterium]|nr:N-6 DNA methylase [Candidatus Paceibacterota bacterium]